MLRTGICAQFYGTPPRFAFIRPQGVEKRDSPEPDADRARKLRSVLNDACAFDLQLTYRPVEENAAELPGRDAIVNQAILSTSRSPDLTPELYLYAVGIVLSRASKMPGRDGDILTRLTTLPQALADHAQKGTLQAQFAQLPPALQPARQLMTLLGSCAFDWSILPESPRKTSLPLQMPLLTLHDANSKALLQQQLMVQWQTTATAFCHRAVDDA